MQPKRILFATSEAVPLIKTGGLGDVGGSLPPALKQQRCDVRLVMPGYRDALAAAGKLTLVSILNIGTPTCIRILEGKLPGTSVKLWLVDSPPHFDRQGGPYVGPDGFDWPDNAERFAVFARVIEALALDKAGLDWLPDVVHCNDWQTGLVPALLAHHERRPATVFTVHNLAYQGSFSAQTFEFLCLRLQLPRNLWSMHGLEFHGRLSLIKGGLAYADMLNTVSPTYAREILRPEFGYGLEGLLNHRSDYLTGILNGVDYTAWNPATDPHIPRHYDASDLSGKAINKAHLQDTFGLPQEPRVPLIGMVGRLVDQKGGDLVLDLLPKLAGKPLQLVVLGTGDASLERKFEDAAKALPGQVAVHVGFSEKWAHLIEAGADLFLMPSRFEPCGLNQIYSLRYGTVPIVRRTGGLADTVVDATGSTLANGTATGFCFDDPTVNALQQAVHTALAAYDDRNVWRQLVVTGMQQDYSWNRSAREYLALYRRALGLLQAGGRISAINY